MRLIVTLAALAVTTCGIRAEERPAPHPADAVSPALSSAFALPAAPVAAPRPAPGRALWMASVAALAAANIADAHSSWSKYESNPAMAAPGRTFGARGAAIKGGVNAAWVVGQIFLLRKYHAHRALAVINLVAASAFAACAAHNYGVEGASR